MISSGSDPVCLSVLSEGTTAAASVYLSRVSDMARLENADLSLDVFCQFTTLCSAGVMAPVIPSVCFDVQSECKGFISS